MRTPLIRSSILTLVAAGLVTWGTASTPPLPVAEFWDRVQATLKTVDSLQGQDTGAVRAALEKEAAAWEGVTSVQLDGGGVMPIDTSGLVDQLRANPPDLIALHTRFQALLDARDNWYPSGDGSGGGTGQDPELALRQVLAGPDFQQQTAAPNPIQAFIDNLQRKFWGWVVSLLPSEITTDITWVRWAVILIGGLLLAAILWLAMRTIARGLVAEDDLDSQGSGGIEVVSSESAFKRAQETSRAGDYRSAVRWLYLSSLLILDERGVLHYDRTRTNREYLRSVGNAPELAHSLGDIVDVFDRVWYGFQPIDPATFEQYVKRVTELRRIR
jgi:hypothetical protein